MSANASQLTWTHRAARLLTAVYAIATAVAAGRLLFGHHHRGAFWDMAFGLLNIPVASSFLAVVVLLLVTRALIGRKRVALWLIAFFQVTGIAIGILALLPAPMSPVLNLWRPPMPLGRVLDVAAIGVAVPMLVVLWKLRPLFAGRVRQGSWWLAAAAGLAGAAVTAGVMWLLLGAQPDSQQRISGVADTVTDVLSGGTHARITGVRPWVVDITTLLAGLTLLTAITVFLASARSRHRWSADKELDVRRLLLRHGADDSLGYFNTRRDRSSVFSSSGDSAVTYRVIAGISLAAADPVGDRTDWSASIGAWRAEARSYGWQPAVLAASEAGARAYAAAGMRVVRLGDEAILDAGSFSIRRPGLTDVQRSAARARRAGVVIRIRRQSDIKDAELNDIANATHDWLTGVVDRGFSMALNRELDPTDRRCVVVTAQLDDQLVGVLRFVPWGRRDLSLDLMRRSAQAPGGVTELMVTELMATADRLGIGRVSLNFCMFRGVFAEAERIGGRSLTKLNAGVLGVLDRFWQLERLYIATQKYQPSWEPRFLCYDDPLVLPQVVLAAAAAEGFLPWPKLSDRAPEQFPPALLEQAAAIELGASDPVPTGPVRGDQGGHRLGLVRQAAAEGLDPYPAAVPHSPLSLRRLRESGWRTGRVITVSGRIRAIRNHGGVVFADLVEDGMTIQLVLDPTLMADIATFVRLIDCGDLLSCTGALGRSRNGTPSLLVRSWHLEAKALRPLPWKALGDPTTRLPNRSADLLLHPEDLTVLRQRSTAVGAVRQALVERGYLEVETPILQNIHGGARARPFKTRLRGSDRDLNLRIAPELYLKQLLVAGFGPVFEIGRNFRNEGADATHNPEFTSLEAYQPGGDYRTMLRLARELIIGAATAVYGKPVIPLPRDAGHPGAGEADPVDISGAWPVIRFLDAVSRAVGQPVDLDTDLGRLTELAELHEVDLPSRSLGPGAVLEELYSKLVEPVTIFPTFYTDFPRETSPLTRPHRSRPGLVERWDLVAAGMEVGTAYTELTDPLDQRRRLTVQSLQAVAGDPEAMEIDETFLSALELGMPPSGGLGIGIDRLVMLLTHRPIRSVLTFPFNRQTH
jgi:lysyl-tRNA synthetase, class II